MWIFLTIYHKKHHWHVPLITRWQHLVASRKATDIINHQSVDAHVVLYRCTDTAIKTASKVGTFFSPWWQPGQYRVSSRPMAHPVASSVALERSIGQFSLYRILAPSWLSKWPVTELHLLLLVNFCHCTVAS